MSSHQPNPKAGEFMSIWRIDVGTQSWVKEPVPETWKHLGGRGLLARILVDEVPADCDPLGPKNKLVFAPGLLAGHMLSSCDRISIGAKSPLTGGCKEANAAQGTPLGRILGSGAATAGKVLGVKRVPVVKGQAMSAYDPRAIKGTGVTYATTPQGADHTCGLTIRAKVDHLNPEGQAKLSRNTQINVAGYDTLGACIFAAFGFGADPAMVPNLLHARYGEQVEADILARLGRETIELEREFNRRAGFTKNDDRLPEWMVNEPLPPHQAVFDVSDEDLDTIFDW